MAYQSNETGRAEVYVQSFPPTGDKWQISTTGGEEPYWRRDGKELFYIAGKRLMVVDVKTDGQVFHPGVPRPLFEVRLGVGAPQKPLPGRRQRSALSGQRAAGIDTVRTYHRGYKLDGWTQAMSYDKTGCGC